METQCGKIWNVDYYPDRDFVFGQALFHLVKAILFKLKSLSVRDKGPQFYPPLTGLAKKKAAIHLL